MAKKATNKTASATSSGPIAQTAPPAPGDDPGILAYDLMTEIMGTVPAFGGKEIIVGFFGEDAFVDQKRGYVNIPALPPAMMIPTSIAREIRGFGSHEAAHVLWTDPDWTSTWTDAEKGDPLFKSCVNVVEDFMIERNFLAVYPGAHKNFSEVGNRAVRNYQVDYAKNPDVAKDLRIVGPLALVFARFIGLSYKTSQAHDCLKTLPSSLQQRVWNWYQSIQSVETTSDSIDIARQIYADIQANPYDPANPPANPFPITQPGQPGQGGKGASSQNLTPGAPTPLQVSQGIGQALDELGIDPNQTPKQLSFSVPSSATEGPAQEVLADPQGLADAQAAMADARSTVGTVSQVLRRALQSVAKSTWKSGRADGVIDDKRLAGVMLGNLEIHRKKIEGEKIDTAVSILIDCSGSMDVVIAICQQLGLILQAAFQGTPIKFEIIGYTSGDEENLPPSAKVMATALAANGQKDAVRTIEIYQFKGFSSTNSDALLSLGNMTRVKQGGTPTGDAILIAHSRLSKRPERRHVMMVLTDGAPDDAATCKQAVESVERYGVSVLGMGIGSNAVQTCFRNWVVIGNANDLPAVVLSHLSTMLLRDKRKYAIHLSADPQHIKAA
jgi:Mg-chelatase subunit ChlD